MENDDDFLMISGINQYLYCRRRWELVHVEQLWEENEYTIRGDNFHNKVDDPFFTENRSEQLIRRSVAVKSNKLKFYGICDLIIFEKASKDGGIEIKGYNGKYNIIPVEYKVGHEKIENSDRLQLMLQIISLEEMFNTKIDYGYVYYGKTRRRERIDTTSELRKETERICSEMREIFEKKELIKPVMDKRCIKCSLKNSCLPELSLTKSVEDYINKGIEE